MRNGGQGWTESMHNDEQSWTKSMRKDGDKQVNVQGWTGSNFGSLVK